MEIPTFHTIEDLCWFYKDFENILEIFEHIQYFLHYKNSLNISDEIIIYKIADFEKIFLSFLIGFGELYYQLCTETSENFIKIIRQNSNNWDTPFHLTIQKFLIDVDYYRKSNQNSLLEKFVIEENIGKIILSQESDLNNYSNGLISKDEFIWISIKNYFSLIELRVKLAKNSPFGSVFSLAAHNMDVSTHTINTILDSCDDILKNYSIENISLPQKQITAEKAIQFTNELLFPKYSRASEYFKFLISNGCVDFSSSSDKSLQSFTSWILGKNPKILLNFHGNISDIISLAHEFWHAFQMNLSNNNKRIEFAASPFMSEFSASFFEKILENFWKNNPEFNAEYEYLQQKTRNTILSVFRSAKLEKQIYEWFDDWEFFNIPSFTLWLHKNNTENDLLKFFTQTHIFYSPFYVVSYIFAYIFSEFVFNAYENFDSFEKIINQGGSDSVENIFWKVGINIEEFWIYSDILGKIFHKDN